MSSNALMETVGFELCSKHNSLLAGSFEKVWVHEQMENNCVWKHAESTVYRFFLGEANADFKGKLWSEAQTESSPFPELYTFQL